VQQRLQDLQSSLAQIDEFIRAAVFRADSGSESPTDSLRGLIVSREEVEEYLGQPPLSPPDRLTSIPALATLEFPENTLLNQLVSAFRLTGLDASILLLCLAPELDRRYERLYAYLQDDVSERRPTVNLMMNLLGRSVAERFTVWERLAANRPLRQYRLLETESRLQQSGLLSQILKVDHRVVAFLLGDGQPDERLKQAVRFISPDTPISAANLETVYRALPEAPMVYMQGRGGMGESETAAALCAPLDWPLLQIDLPPLNTPEGNFDLTWRLALREGYLNRAAILLDGWESCLDEHFQPPLPLWQALLDYPLPVFLRGKGDWEPADVHRTRRLLRLSFSIPAYAERREAWEQLMEGHGAAVEAETAHELANKFRFTRSQIARAVQSAADRAASRGETMNRADLYSGAQAHASLRLGHLAQRISPRYTWTQLILPPDPLAQLRELASRIQYAHVVNDEWGFAKNGGGRGVSALFAGESGTGKTLAAEVIAGDLGLVLYKIDLSAVVSKYIGETEKNLNSIFSEAQSGNAILFFDEADALFGKRSEVRDAHDRYANIEVAYLLQQIEDYDGLVVLATNFRQNIDEAFTRRLDFLIDFPFPDVPYRQQIWAAHFPTNAPLSAEVDLAEIAARYRLAGGNIRNAALAAAYLAAADGQVITSAHIRSAIRREHQKMGRLLDEG
jgi:winged helix domain-containing protein/ATPase family protein associated with various cellular activities (AAA)